MTFREPPFSSPQTIEYAVNGNLSGDGEAFEFKDEWDINVGDPANMTWWKKPEHQVHSREITDRWTEFLDKPIQRTRQDVLNFGEELAEEFKDGGCGVFPE